MGGTVWLGGAPPEASSNTLGLMRSGTLLPTTMTTQGYLGIDQLQRIVEQRFQVYDVRADDQAVAFYIQVDAPGEALGRAFEKLRKDLKPRGLVPLLKYEGGEHTIYVLEKPTRNHRSNTTNLVLFILTWITTTLAGMLTWFSYANPNLDIHGMTSMDYMAAVFSPGNALWGFLTFALPLMLILGIHEMGHYVMTKRHGMEASLPFFIPLPPVMAVNIGTLGAFISMREPIPNRKALLDIGVAGPIAGFVVTVPVLLVGLFLMWLDPVTAAPGGELIGIGTPLLYDALAYPFNIPENAVIHPTAFAGWVGLFVTAINLLPAGQLDGGHMASALMADRAHILSYLTVGLLVALGLGIPQLGIEGFGSWLLFALLIAVLGIRHPPTLDNVTELDARRRMVGFATFAIFIFSFTPVPFQL